MTKSVLSGIDESKMKQGRVYGQCEQQKLWNLAEAFGNIECSCPLPIVVDTHPGFAQELF